MDPLHQFFDDLHAWLQTCSPEDLVYDPPPTATLLPLVRKLAADTSSIVSQEYTCLRMAAHLVMSYDPITDTSHETFSALCTGLMMVVKGTPALAVGTTKKAECYRRAIIWQKELRRMRDEQKLEKTQDKKGAKDHQAHIDPVEKFYDDLYVWLQDNTRPRNQLIEILQEVHTSASPSCAGKHLVILKRIAQDTLNSDFSTSND